MGKIVFDFDKMGGRSDTALKDAIKMFAAAGAPVAQSDVSTPMRSSGISFREITFTFADSQIVLLRVKQSGDIYQILVNGKLLPVREQEDHAQAITEIVKALTTGRTAFQKKLAVAKVALPKEIKTAIPNIEKAINQKKESLMTALSAIDAEIKTAQELQAPESPEVITLMEKITELKNRIADIDQRIAATIYI